MIINVLNRVFTRTSFGNNIAFFVICRPLQFLQEPKNTIFTPKLVRVKHTRNALKINGLWPNSYVNKHFAFNTLTINELWCVLNKTHVLYTKTHATFGRTQQITGMKTKLGDRRVQVITPGKGIPDDEEFKHVLRRLEALSARAQFIGEDAPVHQQYKLPYNDALVIIPKLHDYCNWLKINQPWEGKRIPRNKRGKSTISKSLGRVIGFTNTKRFRFVVKALAGAPVGGLTGVGGVELSDLPNNQKQVILWRIQ